MYQILHFRKSTYNAFPMKWHVKEQTFCNPVYYVLHFDYTVALNMVFF